MNKIIEEYIEKEIKSLDRSIVATPSKDYLESFATANNGSNDYLLMQLSIQYGYKLALENIRDEMTKQTIKNK